MWLKFVIAVSLNQDDVLQQIRETELFKHVAIWVSSGSRCCTGFPVSIDEYTSLGSETSEVYFCTSICSKSNGSNHADVVSSSATLNGSEYRGVDLLVPMSPDKSTSSCSFGSCSSICTMKNLEIDNVLTILLFALPPQTWQSIKKEGLLEEIYAVVSIKDFPHILQEAVSLFLCQNLLLPTLLIIKLVVGCSMQVYKFENPNQPLLKMLNSKGLHDFFLKFSFFLLPIGRF